VKSGRASLAQFCKPCVTKQRTDYNIHSDKSESARTGKSCHITCW